MNSVFFFYTLGLLIICIVTAVLAVAAYASSRRRVFLYACGAFSCYALETIEIFFYEYISQNTAFPAHEYYAINSPVMRTAVAVALQACIWLIALDILDKHSKRLLLVPIAVFVIANVIVLLFSETAWRQWVYYTLRQVFLLFVEGYLFRTYLKSRDAKFRERLKRFRWHLAAIVALTICIVIEDTYVILIVPMSLTPSWLPLYLSERNFSENALMLFFAVILIRYAYQVLSIRIKEAPKQVEVNDLDRHVEEQMPLVREMYRLSARETEVLRLVVLGKSNQEIANELYLAVGTVKTHVHNIMVKMGQKTREAAVQQFWKG